MKAFMKFLMGGISSLLLSLPLALMFMGAAQAEDKKPADDKACRQSCPVESSPVEHIDLVLILDKSGSMHGLESDTIGGFNSMIVKQREGSVPVDVTTVLFSNNYSLLHRRVPINEVAELTDKDYRVGGMTALLDAVGRTMDTVKDYPHIKDKGHKAIFVIITDGLENDSREYGKDQVREMVSRHQKDDGWEFIFLGANLDAAEEAGKLGIDKGHAVRYRNSASGVRRNFDAVSK